MKEEKQKKRRAVMKNNRINYLMKKKKRIMKRGNICLKIDKVSFGEKRLKGFWGGFKDKILKLMRQNLGGRFTKMKILKM